MQLTVKVRLFPSLKEQRSLLKTLHLCNSAANAAAKVAFDKNISTAFSLHHEVYYDLKAMGLGAQATVRVIKKVADAVSLQKTKKTPSQTPITFRVNSAQPFDHHILRWNFDERYVSIWSVDGRLARISFRASGKDLETLRKFQKGQSELIFQDQKWYLHAAVNVPTPSPLPSDEFLGVDRGIINIATTSDGENWTSKHAQKRRERIAQTTAALQRKNTKSAKRLLKKRRRKVSRFTKDLNHQISKQIVESAKRSGKSIVLEDLTGILRRQVRLPANSSSLIKNWSFKQLEAFICYKAAQAGIEVLFINPAYTSQVCAECGHWSKKNRVTQALFACQKCLFETSADVNAAKNIAITGHFNILGAISRPHADL